MGPVLAHGEKVPLYLALVDHPSSDGVTIKIPYGVMFYYIDQPRTPSFPIGMVKTESDFIFRSAETGLER